MSASTAGPLARLAQPLIDPATFDFWAAKLNRAWSWSRPLAQVVERRVEAQDTVTLVLRPNRHCGKFIPGQHVNVSAEVNGRRTTRSYSLTDIPRRDGLVSITVKRVEGGHLSTHLCQGVRVGDTLELGPAFGEMTLPPHPEGRWVFLAAGSGITPFMSLVRALAAKGMPVDTTVLYWAKTRAELCFVRELQALAQRHPRLHVHFVLTREPHPLAHEHAGRLNEEILARLAGAWRGAHVRACGPGGFVDGARELVDGHAASFLGEAFTPAPHPERDHSPAQDLPLVKVHLRASGRTVDIPSGQSLLAALEAQGLNPAAGCRMGICHTCVCTKHKGVAQDLNTGEQDTEDGTTLRLCVSRACTDLTLDL